VGNCVFFYAPIEDAEDLPYGLWKIRDLTGRNGKKLWSVEKI